MGRHKHIRTPDKMWELFSEYRELVKNKPILQHDYIGGKDLHEVNRKKERPLTIEGFENYVADQNIVMDLGHYFSNLNNAYEDFLAICSRIRRIVRQDQIEGGMAGIYNPSITQRLNSLTEKTENKNEDNITISFED